MKSLVWLLSWLTFLLTVVWLALWADRAITALGALPRMM